MKFDELIDISKNRSIYPQGAKALDFIEIFSARPRSCPDENLRNSIVRLTSR